MQISVPMEISVPTQIGVAHGRLVSPHSRCPHVAVPVALAGVLLGATGAEEPLAEVQLRRGMHFWGDFIERMRMSNNRGAA